jgi:hypothetical protein
MRQDRYALSLSLGQRIGRWSPRPGRLLRYRAVGTVPVCAFGRSGTIPIWTDLHDKELLGRLALMDYSAARLHVHFRRSVRFIVARISTGAAASRRLIFATKGKRAADEQVSAAPRGARNVAIDPIIQLFWRLLKPLRRSLARFVGMPGKSRAFPKG